jgi:hypothetical protein
MLMRLRRLLRGVSFQAAPWLLVVSLLLPAAVSAQEEVTSSIRRYRDREASTGYYEEHEVKPRRQRPLVGVPEVLRRFSPYRQKFPEVRIRTRLEDSHANIKFYEQRRCEECHVDEAKHSHTIRGNITCRQCHGGEPIASINYYYSPLNPMRRHAYLCAKCHEGAGVSFATYLVHEPKAGDPNTRKTFASLYWANWFMYLLIVGTLSFFVVHSFVWITKELYQAYQHKRRKPEDEPPA